MESKQDYKHDISDMYVKSKAKENHIWVWSKLGEQKASEYKTERRPAGIPAWIGHDLLEGYSSRWWVKSGYVVEAEITEDLRDIINGFKDGKYTVYDLSAMTI